MASEEGNCTLTFMSTTNISMKEVTELFSKFTNSLKCTESEGKIYVKLGTEKEAEKAIKCLGGFINLSKVPMMPANLSFNDDLPHDQLCAHSVGSSSKSYTNQQSSTKAESSNISRTDSSSLLNETESYPHLIDMKSIKKVYPIIVANLPTPFTLEDVLNLVEESEPIGATQLDTTKREKLKYCEIYLRSLQDVKYLKNKLDGFVIGGKKLMVVEPTECLDGCKWIL